MNSRISNTQYRISKLVGTTIIGMSVSVAVCFQSNAQTDCTIKFDKDSIQVSTCVVKNSKFKAVRSTFYLKSTLSEVAAMIMDVDHHSQWQYKTISGKVLKNVNDHEIIYYTETEAPVITSNRDFVIQLKLSQPIPKELFVEMESLPDYIPEKEGIVRVPFSKATWTINKLPNGLLKVDYYIEIDIGGSVPAWMVNSVAHQAPYQTFKAMQAGIGGYRGKGVSFIQN